VADHIVEEKVLVECKATQTLDPVVEARVINYLKVSGLQVALIPNFGQSRLQFKRMVFQR
jgi:GxxExxY protein